MASFHALILTLPKLYGVIVKAYFLDWKKYYVLLMFFF